MSKPMRLGDIMRGIARPASKAGPGQTCSDILKFDSEIGGEGYVCQLGYGHGGPHMRTGEANGRAWGIVWT